MSAFVERSIREIELRNAESRPGIPSLEDIFKLTLKEAFSENVSLLHLFHSEYRSDVFIRADIEVLYRSAETEHTS
jgi:hypothetical protein